MSFDRETDPEPDAVPASGTLVLVAGPSGAGKDSLLSGAQTALAEDDRFVFAQRLITRTSDDTTENHRPVSNAEFDTGLAEQRYALHWQAHGLRYAIPRSIESLLGSGHIVIANVSRTVIADCRKQYPSVRVILIDCAQEIRSARLRARGRERDAEISGRLARTELGVELVSGDYRIDNSGKLDRGISAVLAALREIASTPDQQSLNFGLPVEPA